MLKIGCHVSAAGGVWNAPKNAHSLGCEVFQIFTRPPMGGPAPELTFDIIGKFKQEMAKYYPSEPSPQPSPRGRGGSNFVVHTPYFINFGSSKSRIYHGSISVVREELERASLLGAKYVMTHLGSAKDLGQKKALVQAKQGLKEVLKDYQGTSQFLLEIAAGAGHIIGDTFEELAELMEPLVKMRGFGGICFDTQHGFASGYDLRDDAAVASTFSKFDKIIGLKWLKMSHINDSKVDLGAHKDRHEHIGEGKIGKRGFEAVLKYFSTPSVPQKRDISPLKGEKNNVLRSMPLILETEPDKVEKDIKILKSLRDKKYPALSSRT